MKTSYLVLGFLIIAECSYVSCDKSYKGKERKSNPQYISKVTLPDDFAFNKFRDIHAIVNIKDSTLYYGNPRLDLIFNDNKIIYQVNINCGRDHIHGLTGNGLSVKHNAGTDSVNDFLMWAPEPFSCYRDGEYLGTWDPVSGTLRYRPDSLVSVDWLPKKTLPKDFYFRALLNNQIIVEDIPSIKPPNGKSLVMYTVLVDSNQRYFWTNPKDTVPSDAQQVTSFYPWFDPLEAGKGDAITGLNGRGLTIEQIKVKGFTAYYHYRWEPDPIACYRNGNLLGIWEPSRNKLRSSRTDAEAPSYLTTIFGQRIGESIKISNQI